MSIVNPGAFERSREPRLVELLIMPRSRDCADVHDPTHAVRAEKRDEFFHCARGVADGVNDFLSHGRAYFIGARCRIRTYDLPRVRRSLYR